MIRTLFRDKRVIFTLLLITLLTAACGVPATPPPAPESVGTMTMGNDLESGTYKPAPHTEHGITFQSEYSTDYNAKSWAITANKTLNSTVRITNLPAHTRVQMSHVHVDTSLVATLAPYSSISLNGNSIDSMDDKLATGDQIGVEMTLTNPYSLIFSIDGFSKDLYHAWSFYLSGFGGYSTVRTESMTEASIKGAGVTGQRFTYVYEFVYSVDDGDTWSVGTFNDEFNVPVSNDKLSGSQVVANQVGVMDISSQLASGPYTSAPRIVNGITFQPSYSTVYDVRNWWITQSKTLNIDVAITNLPANTRVQMAHVHIDTSLMGNPGSPYSDINLNGMSIDNMDNKLGAGNQVGVEMTKSAPYSLIFSVEGYSKDFVEGWGYYLSDFGGRSEARTVSLTEEDIRDEGVFGQKFTLVFKFVYSVNGGPWSMGTFVDEFYVPVGAMK
jgi:hypothetical protein